MAIPSMFKVSKTRYVDVNGKRCNKSTPGAIKKTEKLSDWYADIIPTETSAQRIARRAAGLPAPKRKRVRLCKDKRAAQKMLADIVEQTEKQAAGFKDYQAVAHQDLGQLVDDFETHLKTTPKKQGGKRSAKYVAMIISRIQKVFGGCGFLRLSNIDCETISQWLDVERELEAQAAPIKIRGTAKTYQEIADQFGVVEKTVTYWRRKGAPIIPRSENDLAAIAKWYAEFTKPKNISSTTSDHYTSSLKSFGNWLVKPGRRAETNPFNDLDKLNDKTELKKKRRALAPSDFASLIVTATSGDRTFRGLNGLDRAMIYTLAAYTGLRANEIGSLKTDSFEFGDSPTVTVSAADTKNSKAALLPLKADLAKRLESYLAKNVMPIRWRSIKCLRLFDQALGKRKGLI